MKKFFQWPTNLGNHLPFRFCKMAKPPHSPLANAKTMFTTLLQNCTQKFVDYLIMKLESNLQNFFIERLAIFRNTKQPFTLFSLYAPPSRETSKGPWRSLVCRPKRWRLRWKPGSSRPPSVRARRPSASTRRPSASTRRPPAAAGPNVIK